MKWGVENIKAIMAFIVVFLSFIYFFTVTFFNVTADPQVIIAIVAAMSNVLQYYFGASQGSTKKDELISALSSPSPATTNTGDINITQTKPNEIDH